MTIPSTARKAGPLLGTGAQTAWPFTFKVFAAADVAVTIADSLGVETALVLDTDYSVTLNANQETSPGGTVTYPISGSALAVGSKLSIIGDLDYDQPLDLPSGGNFSPLALENQLDRTIMQVQQLEETASRALLVPVTSSASSTLPNPEPNALIGWDSTGDTLANYTLAELATGIAYGTMRFDTFTGNGSTTQFALTEDPAALANLDVSIAGVTQVPGTDYTLTSATLVFTTAPVNGVAILARYGRALPISGPVDSSAVTHVASGTGAVAMTVQEKFRTDLPSVTDYDAIADSFTDNTAAILAAAVSSGKKFLIVPYGVKYDRAALLAEASFPDDVVLLDLSGINDFSSPGETTKHFGIVSKDSAPDDTHWAVDSGHHAILTTNNFGTAGTTSANERKASWLWAAGQFALGAVDKRGFRAAAIQQFTQETGQNFWKWQIRSVAPWVSIAGEYEYWETGQVISGAGAYRLGTTSQQYVSAGAGTCGATPPTHTSGTVSDGGVSWTWIDSGDRTVFQADQYGRWIIGSGTTGNATWAHKVNKTDPAGSYRFKGISTGVTKIAQFQLIPTDGAGVEVDQPFLRAEAGAGLRVMNSAASTSLAVFSDSGGLGVNEFASLSSGVVNSSTGATPSVDGIGTIYIGNGGATNITDLANPSNDQIVHLVFTNANTTLVSSATFLLAGSVNVTPTAYSVVTMKRVHSSISGRWIELSRSIK